MFIEVLVIAIVIGLILGGKFTNLGRLDFKYIYAVFAAFLVQSGIDFWAPGHVFWGYPYLHISSYFILFFVLWKNRQLPGMNLILAGTILNFIVIAANGGQMPVRGDVLPPQLLAIVAGGHGGTHGLIMANTKMRFLADIFYIAFLNKKQLISLGDIIMNAGVLVLVIKGMKLPQQV